MNKKKVNRILNVFFSTRLKVFLACVAMLLFWQNTFSQTYPVQVQTTTKPPYYNYLAYYGDFNNNLSFVATLLDFNAPPVSVRLRLKISGPGYSYRTRTDIPVGNVFVLSPGMPTFIQGNDLLPYFNPVNLVAEQGTVNWNNMPEGLTTFCVEVIKVGVNNEVLSAESCSSFFLQLMQPPQPFLPFCNSTVDTTQMFHTFSWSPPLNYTPAFGAELNYNFSLYEWLDTNNYNIFQTGQGLVFSTQTQVPLVQVSNFDVLFQAGRKYVWRVQAQLSQNGLPIQMITQNGLSVPCSFYYGQPQSLAGSLASGLQINLNAQAQSERKGTASWTVVNTSGNGLSGFSSYILEYRKKPTGNENFEFYWFTDTVYSLSKAIYQLEPSTTYECRLRGVFGDYTSDYTPTVEFTTAPPYEYTCGDQNMPWMSAQFTPLAQAEAGMVWQMGQFSMTVTAIYGSDGNGRFSGAGRIPVEFLAGAQAQVTFVDILVDNEFNVREGVANVNTSGVDAWLHAQYAQFVQPIYVDGVVDTAYVQDGVAFVVVDGQTLQFEFDPPDYPIIIHDDNGVSYTIYPDGTVAVGSYFVVEENWSINADEAVHFAQNANETFGFDPKENNQWHENYTIIQLVDSTHYFAANKSLGINQSDVVNVTLPSGGGTYTYQIGGGPMQNLSGNTIILPAIPQNGQHQLYVYENGLKVGLLNLEVYEEKEVNVVVVPLVNNAPSKIDLEASLEQTLGEANIKFNVTVAPQWNNATYTSSMTLQLPQDVGAFNKYSEEMRALRDAYFEDTTAVFEEEAYYLFVVPNFSDNNVDGYMVRGKALGFIKAGAATTTYAHELGHGFGDLDHTWHNGGPAEGSTNNLMDYGGGENLTKTQWKELRRNRIFPSMWDGEEDGMLALAFVIANEDDFLNEALEFNNTFNNCTNSHLMNFISGSKEIVKFDESIWVNIDVNEFEFQNGILKGFKINQGIQLKHGDFLAHSIQGIKTNGEKYFYKNHYFCAFCPDALNWPKDKKIIAGQNYDVYRKPVEGTPFDLAKWNSLQYTMDSVSCEAGISIVTDYYNGNPSCVTLDETDCAKFQNNQETNDEDCDDAVVNQKIQNLVSTFTASNISAISYGDLEPILIENLNSCVYQNMPFNLRQLILEKYFAINNDKYWEISPEGLSTGDQFFIKEIILKTPLNQRIAMLNYLKSNQPVNTHYNNSKNWLALLYNASTTYTLVNLDVAPEHIYEIFYTVSSWVSANFSQLNISPTPLSLKINNENVEGLDMESGQFPFLILKPGQSYKFSLINHTHEESDIYVNSTNIGFDERISLAQVLISDHKGFLFIGSWNEIERTNDFDPYEYVSITLNQDYLGFTANEEYVVPALMAFTIQWYLDKEANDENIRQLTNTAAIVGGILAAPFTGGTSLAGVAAYITVGGAVVAYADMFVTNYKAGHPDFADTDGYKYWNSFYNTYMLVDGIAGGVQLALGIAKLPGLLKIHLIKTKWFQDSQVLGNWIAQRNSFWDNWINMCFPNKDWGNTTFITKGENFNTFKTNNSLIYNDMKALNPNEIKLQEFIESGSSIPVKVPIYSGDEYFKIVPKGNNIASPSAYYIDQAQLNLIKTNPEKLEQILGLPLGSVSAEYDVFKITYQGGIGYVFKSTVAATEQYANATPSLKYLTTGGGNQILILDNMDPAKWLKGSTPIETITPNKLPLIGN